MNDKRAHARAWLAKAESDRLAAQRLLDACGPFDAVCFHAQQRRFLGTHNLEELQVYCLAAIPASTASALRSLDLSELTPYAVETRYDAEFWPDRATAEVALRSADRTLELISGFLAQQ